MNAPLVPNWAFWVPPVIFGLNTALSIWGYYRAESYGAARHHRGEAIFNGSFFVIMTVIALL